MYGVRWTVKLLVMQGSSAWLDANERLPGRNSNEIPTKCDFFCLTRKSVSPSLSLSVSSDTEPHNRMKVNPCTMSKFELQSDTVCVCMSGCSSAVVSLCIFTSAQEATWITEREMALIKSSNTRLKEPAREADEEKRMLTRQEKQSPQSAAGDWLASLELCDAQLKVHSSINQFCSNSAQINPTGDY